MSEDRLVRIEAVTLESRADIAALRSDVTALQSDVTELRSDVTALGSGLRELGESTAASLAEQRRYMSVLHEEVLDRIKALAFDPEPLRREFRAADAEIRDEFNRRPEPIEASVRSDAGRRRRSPRR